MKIDNYYVINLETVEIKKGHPYTLTFTGYIPCFGGNRLCTFTYDGKIYETDAVMPEKVKEDFEDQLRKDYGYGMKFDINKVNKQLNAKHQYRMKM